MGVRPWILGIGAFIAVSATAAARAQTFDFLWVSAQGNYDVQPGQALTVPLFLVSVTPAGANRLEEDDGLFAAGLSVRRSANGSGTPADLTSIMANAAVFPDVFNQDVLNSGLARLSEARTTANGSGTEVVGSARRVWVGSVTLAAGDRGTVTEFQIRDFVNEMGQIDTTDQTVTGKGGPIDANIGSGTFTVSTTPEPDIAAQVGLAAVALLARRQRIRLSRARRPRSIGMAMVLASDAMGTGSWPPGRWKPHPTQ